MPPIPFSLERRSVERSITMKEAASRLGVSRAKIWKLVQEGILPARQNPLDKRQRLIPESAIHRLQKESAHPRLGEQRPGSHAAARGPLPRSAAWLGRCCCSCMRRAASWPCTHHRYVPLSCSCSRREDHHGASMMQRLIPTVTVANVSLTAMPTSSRPA